MFFVPLGTFSNGFDSRKTLPIYAFSETWAYPVAKFSRQSNFIFKKLGC